MTCKGATQLSGCVGGVSMTFPTPGPTAVRPHAPLTVNGLALEYSAEGNVSEEGNREFQYNPIGKMSLVREAGTNAASFGYDGEDELGLINDYSTESVQKRWILTPDFEWNQTAQLARIHVSLGGSEIATDSDAYNPLSGPGSCSGVAPSAPLDIDRMLANLLLALMLLGLSVALRTRPRRAWGRSVVAVVAGAALFAVTSFPTPVGVATIDPANAALQQVEFYHADAIGSSVLVTNEAGTVVQRTVYEPYGKAIPAGVGPTNPPEFGFTNQRFIKRAEVYDYGARMYDPKLGRFLQPDSIVPDPTDPQSLNRYSYVRNGPTNRIDPTGNEDDWWYGGSTTYYGYYLDWLRITLGYDYSQLGPEDPLASMDWERIEENALTFGLEAANSRSPVDVLGFYGVFRNYLNMTSILQEGVGWAGAPPEYAGQFDRALTEETASLVGNVASVASSPVGGLLGGPVGMAGGPLLVKGVTRYGDDVAGSALQTATHQGFHSFPALKRALGPAGPDMHWHHVVEQTRGNVGRFGAETIHNTQNVIALDVGVHRQISAYYSRIQPFTGGQIVRNWLSTQSFEAQREFGVRVLRDFGVTD
jgi:RHS repeat-associated protein